MKVKQSKNLGISISVFFAILLAPFSVLADEEGGGGASGYSVIAEDGVSASGDLNFIAALSKPGAVSGTEADPCFSTIKETIIIPFDGLVIPIVNVSEVDNRMAWYLGGGHSWEWKHRFAYLKYKISAYSGTYYATSAGGCAWQKPLIVDRLTLFSELKGSDFSLSFYRVSHDVDFIQNSENATVGPFDARPCGARSEHIATKDGVTWATYSRSGCSS